MNYGRYQIVREIGRGSMGVVYQALDPRIDRLVALKVLRQDRMASEEIVRRFLKEAKAIGRLTHPHIVTVYDIGEEEGTVYIAMEFIEGLSLAELIEEKRLGERDILSIGMQLAETLDFAHQRGVVHRDIKPSNIIVQKGNNVKITDFGIAHIEDPSGTMQTQLGEILGTPAYMSPEQVMGQPVDGRSDIFSLGIILYELSTGQRPFGDRNKGFLTVFNEILKNTPQEPLVINPRIPKRFSEVIKKALEKEPEKRFQTGNSLAEALSGCVSEKEKRTIEALAVQKRKPQMNYAIPIAVVLVMAVLIGGGIYFSSSLREKLGLISAGKGSSSSKEKEIDSSISNQSQPAEQEDKEVKSPADKQMITSSDALGDKPGAAKVEAIPPEGEKKTAGSSTHVAPERTNVKQTKITDQRKPRGDRKVQSSSELGKQATPSKEMTPGPHENATTNVPIKPVPKFAFLKIDTTPSGAEVYINGALKGKTPIIVKLDLGQYQVRLTRAGHKEVERLITLEKMMEYPLTESLKPLE